MCQSPVGRNVSLHLGDKDTFTGVHRKHCGLDTFINVSKPSMWKCVYISVADTFTGVAKKHCGLAIVVGHTYKCVIAQCADMCLPGYVAKAPFIEAVQWKSLIFCV